MRKHLKDRILALWLAVCMVLTMMPSMAMPVFAGINVDGGDAPEFIESVSINESSIGQFTGSGTQEDPYAADVSLTSFSAVTLKVTVTDESKEAAEGKWVTQDSADTVTAVVNGSFNGEETENVEKTATVTGLTGKNQLAFTMDKDGAEETGQPVYFLISVYPDGKVTPAKALTLTRDEKCEGETLDLELKAESKGELKFADGDARNADFTLGGDAATGLKVVQANKAEGNEKVTLTLQGTPTVAGTIAVKISKEAFDPQPVGDITVEGSPEVKVDAGKTANPQFASANVMCEDGNTKAVVPLKDVSYAGDHGKVTVEVYDGAGGSSKQNDPTAEYDKDSNSIILTFTTPLSKDTEYQISVQDGDRTVCDTKAKINVLTYKEITPDPVIADTVAEQGNTNAVAEVENASVYENVTPEVYSDEAGAEQDSTVTEHTYKEGKLSLTFSEKITTQKTYYVVFTDKDKAPSSPVKLVVKPVTTTPTITGKAETTATADDQGNANTKAEFTITSDSNEYAEQGTVDVAVYKDAEKSALAAGVTGKYDVTSKKLTLSFDPALTKNNNEYFVAFTYTPTEGEKYAESGTLKVTVDYVPTTAPMIVGGETESIEIDADSTNKKAVFTVDNVIAYSEAEEVTANVYKETGDAIVDGNPSVAYTKKDGTFTFTFSSELKTRTAYEVTLKADENLESKKLKVIVNPYVKSGEAEMTAVAGTIESDTVNAEPGVSEGADGTSPAKANPWHFNVLKGEDVTKVELTVSSGASVKSKASSTELADVDGSGWNDNEGKTGNVVTISPTSFKSNKYLYIEVTAEDGVSKSYYVITLSEADLEAGKPAASDTRLGAYTEELGKANVDKTAVANDSESILGRTIVENASEDTSLVEMMNNEGEFDNPAEGTVWKKLKDSLPDIEEKEIHYYYEPYLAIDVEAFDAAAKTMELDITPMYNVVASTNDSSDEYNLSKDAVLLKKGVRFEVNEEVKVELMIPAAIAGNGQTVYVKHAEDPWNQYEVASNKVNVTVSSFSPFYIQANVPGAAQVDGNSEIYDTVQDAVDALTEDAQTIKLTENTTEDQLKNLTPPTGIIPDTSYDGVGVTFTMSHGDSDIYPSTSTVTFNDTVVDGYRYHAEINDSGKVTVTRKKVYDIIVEVSGTGSVIADPNPAAAGDPVTLTVAGELQDMKALNVYLNEEILIDPEASTFTMPASPVRITAAVAGGSVEPGPGPDVPVVSGDLTVSKTVTGDEGDKTKEFNFTVTLGDTAISGTYGNMTFANGVATFKLKDGQSVKATSLPKDTTYTVAEAEANQDGYTTTATGATGTITAGTNITAAFVNAKGSGGDQPTPPPVGENTLRFASPAQEEALKDRATNDKDCALKLEAIDGADIGDLSSWKVESDNPDVVQVLDNNELRYMDLGTANITVTATGKDGKTYTITFPVNVTKLGTPTFTLSHVSSRKARTFTVTTSTVRGATGFQVQYSLKKSLKSSKQPSYAVGKKLNRKTIKANKSKRTYYVRVRAYKIVDGERINGAWSKLTKKIKSR